MQAFNSLPLLAFGSAALFGLVIGSFLNVVIFRLPGMLGLVEPAAATAAGETWSLATPPSRCPACGHRLPWHQNIPVVSYLALRGRCAGCARVIPIRYPVVELLTAGLATLCLWRFQLTPAGLFAFVFCALLLVITYIDLDTFIVPDRLTLPGIWLGLGINAFALFTAAEDAILGAIVGYGVLGLINGLYKLVARREGIGRGDWKLAALIGAWLGLEGIITTLICAFALGGLLGLGLMLAAGRGPRTALPFGPFLAVGGAIALLVGADLMGWYMSLIVGP
ncbi:MAG: prepilin peptidase [Alphaproteobacteria bacterium]|nr:prepilin peptidase [Alphaproteobacteria bacterium]MDP6814051.1 prepilin peptidase [Alphaproteobacteria bacterium]